MRGCFDGIGQWAATFDCENVKRGQVVKIGGCGEVSACDAGEAFCGMAVSVGRDGRACSVALGGMVTAGFSGTAPALGWAGLSADGIGGVQADESGEKRYRVVDVDKAAAQVTFAL